MPFTAAHPLAVVPLVRWHRRLGLDPTCLVIGSMAPDVEYFARGELVGTFGHTLAGLALWVLPVTLVLAALAHAVVKWPMLVVAPAAIARRAAPVIGGPWRARWSVAAVASCAASAVLGGATHLMWDAFTHADGWGPRHVHALTAKLAVPGIGIVVVHRALQHASTLIGLVALGALVVRRLGRGAPVVVPDVPRAGPRAVVAACALAGVALAVARLAGPRARDPGDLIAATIGGVLAGVIVASAILAPHGRRLRRAITSA